MRSPPLAALHRYAFRSSPGQYDRCAVIRPSETLSPSPVREGGRITASHILLARDVPNRVDFPPLPASRHSARESRKNLRGIRLRTVREPTETTPTPEGNTFRRGPAGRETSHVLQFFPRISVNPSHGGCVLWCRQAEETPKSLRHERKLSCSRRRESRRSQSGRFTAAMQASIVTPSPQRAEIQGSPNEFTSSQSAAESEREQTNARPALEFRRPDSA